MAKVPRVNGAATPGEPTLAPPAGTTPGVTPKPAAQVAPRLSFPLTDDQSKIAYGKLQEKVRSRLRTVLSDPDLQKELGVKPVSATAAPSGEAFPPEIAAIVVDALGAVMVKIAAGKGIPERAADCLAFKKHQTEPLSVKGAKIIDKWAPNSLGKWGEEADFGAHVLMYVKANIDAMREVLKEIEQGRQPSTPVTEFPRAVNGENDNLQ